MAAKKMSDKKTQVTMPTPLPDTKVLSETLFTLEVDSRLEDLRNWIKYQWAFKCWYFFWPTEAQIVTIAGWFKVLCETVIDECDAEFIRHCEPSESEPRPNLWEMDQGHQGRTVTKMPSGKDIVEEAREILNASNAYTLRIQVRELLGALAGEVEHARRALRGMVKLGMVNILMILAVVLVRLMTASTLQCVNYVSRVSYPKVELKNCLRTKHADN